ncbi:MAG TPA: signaling protein, partial [Acidiferrobacteraceae bacterium]|nr:signaling protein [Acidiferrobacteraceae bacterium]
MPATKQKNHIPTWMAHVANAAGGLVVLLGLVVMVGWFTDFAFLVQLRPQWAPMQFNTALGFILCGVGLVSLLYNRSRLAVGCAGLSMGIALLTLLQYSLGADFGIDRFLFEPGIVTKTAFPGRMAPVTAMAHLLSGLALMALAAGPRWLRMCLLMVRLFGMGVLALGLGNLLGYVVGGETPYGWSHSTYMAAHS